MRKENLFIIDKDLYKLNIRFVEKYGVVIMLIRRCRQGYFFSKQNALMFKKN